MKNTTELPVKGVLMDVHLGHTTTHTEVIWIGDTTSDNKHLNGRRAKQLPLKIPRRIQVLKDDP